jgi:uncharacterized protein (DUF736 family)
MNVGFFNKKEDGSIFGHLPTMGLQNVSLEPVSKQGKGPDYRASIEGAELGAAWKKKAQSGTDYLSFKVVIPGRDAVWLAIFATKTEGQYVAAYSEPRDQSDGSDA